MPVQLQPDELFIVLFYRKETALISKTPRLPLVDRETVYANLMDHYKSIILNCADRLCRIFLKKKKTNSFIKNNRQTISVLLYNKIILFNTLVKQSKPI